MKLATLAIASIAIPAAAAAQTPIERLFGLGQPNEIVAAYDVRGNVDERVAPGERLKKLGLPAIESLTPASDYSVFMAPNVPADIRMQALHKLWSFPFYNTTDGLTNYSGDYNVNK